MASVTHHRAKVANAIRHHPDDPEAIDEARRGLKKAKLQAEIEEAVSQAPLLTTEERARLAVILLAPGQVADVT